MKFFAGLMVLFACSYSQADIVTSIHSYKMNEAEATESIQQQCDNPDEKAQLPAGELITFLSGKLVTCLQPFGQGAEFLCFGSCLRKTPDSTIAIDHKKYKVQTSFGYSTREEWAVEFATEYCVASDSDAKAGQPFSKPQCARYLIRGVDNSLCTMSCLRPLK